VPCAEPQRGAKVPRAGLYTFADADSFCRREFMRLLPSFRIPCGMVNEVLVHSTLTWRGEDAHSSSGEELGFRVAIHSISPCQGVGGRASPLAESP
jgi:hypothetical protein